MRPLRTIDRDLHEQAKRYHHAATHHCTDAQFAVISDRYWDLLTEYNAAAKAEGRPQSWERQTP